MTDATTQSTSLAREGTASERDAKPRGAPAWDIPPKSSQPRWLRVLTTFFSFSIFFVGSIFLGILFVPLVLPFALFRLERYRTICTRLVGKGFGYFLLWLRIVGLITYDLPKLPEEVGDRPYIVVANHPSLIDVIFLLHAFRDLTSVVKWSWYNFGPFALVLRSLHYVPGGGATPLEAAESETPNLDRMVAHVQAGHPLISFPEGSRSLPDRLRRFRRGAFETAVRAKVPIVVVAVDADRPILDKSDQFWKVPEETTHYHFEVLEVIETDPERGGIDDAEAIRRRVRDELAERFAECLARRPPRLEG